MAKHQPGPAGVAASCLLHEIEDAKAAPVFFTCSSGELLWGQLHTVIAGFVSPEVDTELGPLEESDADPPPGGHGGTVLAGSFRYKVAARKGQWKVEATFLDNSEGEPWHVGFVCHHIDVGGVEILRRAAEAGLGGNGNFADLDVVFVDRYDWSGSHSPGCELIVQTVEGKEVDVEAEDFEDERYYRSLVQGRFMLIDTDFFPSLLQALRDGKRIENRNYVMRKRITSVVLCPLIQNPQEARYTLRIVETLSGHTWSSAIQSTTWAGWRFRRENSLDLSTTEPILLWKATI